MSRYTTAVRTQGTGMDWTQGFYGPDVAERVADAHRAAGFTVTVEPFTDQDVTHPTATATLAELRLAAQAGRHAHAASRPAAPALDPDVMRLIGTDAPVGQPRTIAIMSAFTSAYQDMCDKEAALILA